MSSIESIKAGLVFGQDLETLYQYAKEKQFAIPAINCVGTNSINAVLEAAKMLKAPIIIQVSHGGGQFITGKAVDNTQEKATILGSISAAQHIQTVAEAYGVRVIIHTDHCAKKLLPWIDGLLKASENHYQTHKKPLFSSHMLDLSEESLKENVQISKAYFVRMKALQMAIEVELGITGGEEDGVDNSHVDASRLYTQPEDVFFTHQELSQVGEGFTIAAAFGNVHGVYKPGNVKLTPKILDNSQQYAAQKLQTGPKPIKFVFHGGSGSSLSEIQEAVSYGVVKMNVDTDTQWAFWNGIRGYEQRHRDYLQSQIGSPEGADTPNKKYYDPRKFLRAGEESMRDRVIEAMKALSCVDIFA